MLGAVRLATPSLWDNPDFHQEEYTKGSPISQGFVGEQPARSAERFNRGKGLATIARKTTNYRLATVVGSPYEMPRRRSSFIGGSKVSCLSVKALAAAIPLSGQSRLLSKAAGGLLTAIETAVGRKAVRAVAALPGEPLCAA